ncbi:protein kinase domain-containing protein [Butyrivibrio sp. MB2005]|uniref:protein kinase domain-containing protein n=1 Tax=Butyrivibrio sp. MB2005 TaxID=1280678 RepID=UPI0003F6EB3F|nr:protein kinase [Butyrivibrio sp. MB2005]
MDISNICPNCMREMGKDDTFCSNCGHNRESGEKESTHALKPFTILQGKYLVGNVIGEGGFGITYIGLDLNLEIRIAIKEFYPNGFVTRESAVTSVVTNYASKDSAQFEKWKDSFVKEARSLAKFSNLPGIVHVRDFFQENNTAYIVMEYVEGETLKNYLKNRGGRIQVQETLSMMLPVIQSLARVHEAQIVHRDISPDNIMIQDDGAVKLIDFGAARDFSAGDERSMSVLLKPGFAPEEQYRSKGNQGPWTDVYALCATIYRCITGEKPPESMERMRQDDIKKPSSYGIQISPSQEAALMQGLEVFAEKRIKTMGELEAKLYNLNTAHTGVTESTPYVPEMTAGPSTAYLAPPIQATDNSKNKKLLYIAIIGALAAAIVILGVILVVNMSGSRTPAETEEMAYMGTEGSGGVSGQLEGAGPGGEGDIVAEDGTTGEVDASTEEADSVTDESAAQEELEKQKEEEAKKAEEEQRQREEEEKRKEEERELAIHRYEIVCQDMSWIEAYYECVSKGGYLVNINSIEEYNYIIDQIKRENRDELLYYIGAKRDPNESDGQNALEYHWVKQDNNMGRDILNGDNGNPIYRNMWLSGEPGFGSTDNDGNVYIEQYIDLIRIKNKENDTFNYFLNDIPSDVLEIVPSYSGRIGYICEYDD